MSLDDELSSSMIQIHYPCLLQVEGAGSKVLVTYSRFYLGKTMGLTSPDQVWNLHPPLLPSSVATAADDIGLRMPFIP